MNPLLMLPGGAVNATGLELHVSGLGFNRMLGRARERGEISHALRSGTLRDRDVVELGDIVRGVHQVQRSPEDITIADLTGVAVQDLMIAEAVLARVAKPMEGGA